MRKSHTVTELMISFCLLWHNCRCVLFTWLQNWCDTPLQMHSVCMVRPVRDVPPIINVIVFELIQSKHFVNVTHEIYVDCWHMIYLLTTGARYKHWCSIWTLLTTCRAIVENWPVSTHKGKKILSKSKTDENVYMIVNVNSNFDYHWVFQSHQIWVPHLKICRKKYETMSINLVERVYRASQIRKREKKQDCE